MPTQNTRPWSPWKILAVAVLGCAFGFGVLIAAAVYWISSNQNRAFDRRLEGGPNRIATARPRPKVRGGVVPARPLDLAQDRDNPSAEITGRSNRVTTAGESRAANAPAPAPVRNAILAFKSASQASFPANDLFRDARIPSLQIEVPPEGIAGLRRSARRYVRATVREENGPTYTNVAIHLKGGPGSFRPLQDVPSFTLNFDRFAEGQTFHGLKKLHLNNSVQDHSFLSEKIGRELFEAAGVPVPRAGNALVNLNGRELGVYVLVEGINKQFLHRYFKDAKGNVYDGHSGTDVTDPLPTNSGENRRDKSRLRDLAEATQEPVETRLASLEKTLDVDRFLTFLAMEMILWHWDGYTMNRNNFRIFHDRTSDRMVFLPQGLDQVLGKPGGPVFPHPGGLVARSILEIPEARNRYRERVAQLSTNVFRPDAINQRIHEVADQIDAVLENIDPQLATAHRARVKSFCRRVQQRASYLHQQISPVPAVKFDKLATVTLMDWQRQLDLGDARLTQERSEQGAVLLHISTQDGCTASWRTSRVLDNGKYRFEARIKTENVVLAAEDPRSGAGLRISRYRTGQKNSGNKDWTPVSFEFEVREDQTPVELVCELRARHGDVWFELDSLKLTHLE